jgi:hypothetical protein
VMPSRLRQRREYWNASFVKLTQQVPSPTLWAASEMFCPAIDVPPEAGRFSAGGFRLFGAWRRAP